VQESLARLVIRLAGGDALLFEVSDCFFCLTDHLKEARMILQEPQHERRPGVSGIGVILLAEGAGKKRAGWYLGREQRQNIGFPLQERLRDSLG